MEDVTNAIKDLLLNCGATLVGFADLSEIPVENRDGMSHGISIAVAMTPTIVVGIKDGPTLEYYEEYNRLNLKLDGLVKLGINFLHDSGFISVGQTITSYTESGSYRTPLPHKTIATRAGLGWIGKCTLLITENFGSAIRLASILTNAPLRTGKPVDTSRCGKCSVCASSCPGKAISGKNWDVTKDRDTFFNAEKCRTKARELGSKIGVIGAFCGKCIEVCPYTQRYIKKSY